MYKAFKSRDEIDRLYVTRIREKKKTEERRECANIKNCVNTAIQELEKYTKKEKKSKKQSLIN